jgi:hypothetical protein
VLGDECDVVAFADWVMGVGEIDLAGAERNIDLPAVPRQGEIIWVSRSIALKVKSVTWMLAEATPWVFLSRSEGTLQSVVEDDGELTMPEAYVDELPASGWTISEF